MAGLFGLIGLGALFGKSISDGAKSNIEYKNALMVAKDKGKDIFYANRTPYWTETQEPVQIDSVFGHTIIKGLKSGTIYKDESHKTTQIVDDIEKTFRIGLTYCKAADYKYFPFYFPHSLSCCSRENTMLCTGIEVETNRKYICFTILKKDKYCDGDWGLVYLEDKPHRRQTEYGCKWEYDAIHDEEPCDYFNNMDRYTKEIHNGYNEEKNHYNYYSKIYHVSEEEYKERTTPIKNYPYKFYQKYAY